MISSELLLISVVVAIVTAVVAALSTYLLSTRQGKKSLQERAQEVAVLAAEKQQLETRLLEIDKKHAEVLETIRSLELSHQKACTETETLRQRKSELETRLQNFEVKAESSLQGMHEAEKQNQSAQTELQESRKQQTDLVVRLQQADEALKAAREHHSKQQQQQADLGKTSKAFEVKAEEAQQKVNESKTERRVLEGKYETLQNQYSGLLSEFTELKTSLEERENSHAKQLALFEEQKQALSEQFKVLANDILDTKTKALQESSKLSLSAMMNPFQQSIDGFKKEVQDIHHRETAQRSELKKELETLKELNQKITTEAHELSTALRGQKKLQGNWGELVLENVLDRSGLQLGKDYKREVSFTTEEGRQRPDAVVYLPQDKHLIIDAKVSLNAYTRFINSEDEAERKAALSEHVKAMGDRIKELADRDYYKLPGLNSPEMVFMFVPIESAFVEALKADETLFQTAIENNVLVATPTTLLTSLNIVRQLWRYEDQNKHTAALAQKADGVFRKLNNFLRSFEGIKKGLDKASEAYSNAEGQLVSGKGNLVKQVGDFKNLAPAIKAELPSYFTDKAGLEIDYIAVESLANEPDDEDGTKNAPKSELLIEEGVAE
ncbi:MAG: DNA recombination protein RmuC [Moraxellaceae bacterium]|nr:MAG: DNA recombination protein RmuC [Moraxellaceae bacterium]